MGYKMNILFFCKVFIFMGVVVVLLLVNVQFVLVVNEFVKDMICQEFIDLNLKVMILVVWWMLYEEIVYKGGDIVILNEIDFI